MDPQFPLHSPLQSIAASVSRTAFTERRRTEDKDQSPFPASGWEADELLQIAFLKGAIDSLGRVTGDVPFDCGTVLDAEIQKAAQKMQGPGTIPGKEDHFKVYKMDFLDCVFSLQKQLGANSPPEIIGGAVAYFLGEEFFVRYLTERFHLPPEKAQSLLEPALRQIRKRPADIDFRQYTYLVAQFDKESFKKYFSQLLTNMLIQKTKNPHLDWSIIKNSYFDKLFLVDEPDKKFGMARFGRFIDGFPLEYFLVDFLSRPFIAFNKSMALTLSPPGDLGGAPRMGIRAYTDQLETGFFQQAALILDAHDVKGVDWRGFLSMMAEITRAGYRTLNLAFMDGLWDNFAQSSVDLKEKVQWAIDNHLLNRGESAEEAQELLVSFYMNLCIYLIERNALDEETALYFLFRCLNPPEPLNLLKIFLISQPLTLQEKLSWFKWGLWFYWSESLPAGALSLNYGKLCYRIVLPKSGATVWIPAALKPLGSIPESVVAKLKLFPKKSEAGCFHFSQFQEWIDFSEAKRWSAELRGMKENQNGLWLSLQIDKARIASRLETELPADWITVLPQVFTLFPEEYEQSCFHALILGKIPKPDEVVHMPQIETISSEREWMLHLAFSSHASHAHIGMKWLTEHEDPAIVSLIEIETWKALQKALSIDHDITYFPWILFAVLCGAFHSVCTLKPNREGKLYLHVGSQSFPVFRSNIVIPALEFYRTAAEREKCLFPVDVLSSRHPQLSSEEKAALKAFSREFMNDDCGLKLFVMIERTAAALLPLYPDLHRRLPAAGHILLESIDVKQDRGSELLRRFLTRSSPLSKVQWVTALLSHLKKECIRQGEELAQKMDAEEQQELWKNLSERLLKHRPDAIPRVMDLLNQISITLQSNRNFFIQWIDEVKGTKKEPKMAEFQKRMMQKYPELAVHPEMKKYRGKVVGWLDTLRRVILKLDEQPEIPLLEQLKRRDAAMQKKIAELKEDEPFADYFLALDVPLNDRGKYLGLLRSRLGTARIPLEKKFALYVKFRFDDGRKWQDLLIELENNGDPYRGLLEKTLCQENDYGAYLWKQTDVDARAAWSELVRRHLRLVKSPLFTELPRILGLLFPANGIPAGITGASYEFTRMSLWLEFRSLDLLARQVSLKECIQFIRLFISRCAKWSQHELLENRDDFFFYYWLVNRYAWNDCGKQFVQAVLDNDPSGNKAISLAKVIGLLMKVTVESSVHAGVSAVEMLMDRPPLREYLVSFIEAVFERQVSAMEGNILDLKPSFTSLFQTFEYDRYPEPISLLQDQRLVSRKTAQFHTLSVVLSQADQNPNGFHAMALSAMPLKGWLEYLKQYLLPMKEETSLACFYLSTLKIDNAMLIDFTHFTGVIFNHFGDSLTLEVMNDFLTHFDASYLAKLLVRAPSDLKDPWYDWIGKLRERCQKVEPVENAGRFKGNLDSVHQLMDTLLSANEAVQKKKLFLELEESINRVTDTVFPELSADPLVELYHRYYQEPTIQKMREKDPQRMASLKRRWPVLMVMCDPLKLTDQAILKNYFQDLKTVFIEILKFGNAFNEERRQEILKYFEHFIRKLTHSVEDLQFIQNIFIELENKVPKKNLLGDPIESFLEVVLTMQYPIDIIPIQETAEAVRPLLKSKKKIERQLAFHWLSGLLRNIDKSHPEQLEPLLTAVLGHPASPDAITFEPAQFNQELTEWLSRLILSFKKIQNVKVKAVISQTFKQFAGCFEDFRQLPKERHLVSYCAYMNVVANAKSLFTLQKPPFQIPLPYDREVSCILEEILTDLFPIRQQLKDSGNLDGCTFAELILRFSDLMMRAMKTATYPSQAAMADQFAFVRLRYQNFYTRLCDLALQDDDRPFLKEALAIWKGLEGLSRDEMVDHLWVQNLFEERLKYWKDYRKREFLKRIEKAQFADEEKGLEFAKRASDCFKELLSAPASICPPEDLSTYFKHFIQFLTQRFQDKQAPGAILKDFLDTMAQTDRLNFDPRSLNTVNLCTDAPLGSYIKDLNDAAKVSATLYRYIHSQDPLVVDTGFYWLGSVLEQAKEDGMSLQILSYVFDSQYRKQHAPPEIKFEGSNRLEIVLEPWMLSKGLNRFLVKIPEGCNQAAQDAVQALHKRCMALSLQENENRG